MVPLDLKSTRPRYVLLNFIRRASNQYAFHVKSFLAPFDLLLLCSPGLLCQAANPRCSSLLGRNGLGEPSPLAIPGQSPARSTGPSRSRCVLGSPTRVTPDVGLSREDIWLFDYFIPSDPRVLCLYRSVVYFSSRSPALRRQNRFFCRPFSFPFIHVFRPVRNVSRGRSCCLSGGHEHLFRLASTLPGLSSIRHVHGFHKRDFHRSIGRIAALSFFYDQIEDEGETNSSCEVQRSALFDRSLLYLAKGCYRLLLFYLRSYIRDQTLGPNPSLDIQQICYDYWMALYLPA